MGQSEESFEVGVSANKKRQELTQADLPEETTSQDKAASHDEAVNMRLPHNMKVPHNMKLPDNMRLPDMIDLNLSCEC